MSVDSMSVISNDSVKSGNKRLASNYLTAKENLMIEEAENEASSNCSHTDIEEISFYSSQPITKLAQPVSIKEGGENVYGKK